MDEFLETTQRAVAYLEETLSHFESAISSLDGAVVLNQNEEFIQEIISRLEGVYDDSVAEKDSCSDAAESIKDILFSKEE